MLFGVIIGLLPFAFPFINIIASANATPTWETLFGIGTSNRLFGRADLFLVSATLAATAAGDLVASGKEKELRKVFAGFWCFAIFIVSVIWYGIISNKIEAKVVYNINGTTKVSLGVFIGTVITSAGCILLAEEVKEEKERGEEDE